MTGWAWCVWEIFAVKERSWECSSLEAWPLDQAGQMHPNIRDTSVTPESCTESITVLWVQANEALLEVVGRENGEIKTSLTLGAGLVWSVAITITSSSACMGGAQW